MRKRLWTITLIASMSLLLTVIAYAKGPKAKPFIPDIPREWTQVNPVAEYPDFTYNGLTPSCAACPDCDDTFLFYVKGGSTNNLVVYFQGGGACWDSMNCLYAPTYYQEVPPLEAFANTEGMGIFDTENPENPFKDWNFVFIPYCTGDIHWGAADHDYPDYWDQIPNLDSWTIRHRGFVNFQAVLKWMKDNIESPHKIFVTGSSAGSYGAIFNFPYIQEAYPNSMASVLGDAGNGVVTVDFQNNYINNWGIQPNLAAWIPGLDKPFSELGIDGIYKSIALYYPHRKVAQYTTAWDWNQTFFYYVMQNISDPESWEEEWPSVWYDWDAQMLEFAYSAAEVPNYRYYIAAGDTHTIMMSPLFYTEDSAGISFLDWVSAMVGNQGGTHGHGGIPWVNAECEDCGDPVFYP
jgi:hypothetical protein